MAVFLRTCIEGVIGRTHVSKKQRKNQHNRFQVDISRNERNDATHDTLKDITDTTTIITAPPSTTTILLEMISYIVKHGGFELAPISKE